MLFSFLGAKTQMVEPSKALPGRPERMIWQLPGVHTTAVGYQGGFTPNPIYEEVCSASLMPSEARLHPSPKRA